MGLKGRIMAISYEQAIGCISIVIERHVAKHGEAPPFVVVVGETALAAHGVRMLSEDVDFYSQVIDEDIVHEVEREMASMFGRYFKIDATPGENLWGPIIFRDIARSGLVDSIKVGHLEVPVRALSLADLVMVKIAADRPKDREDLSLIAEKTNPESLIDRFNEVIGWHGDRSAAMSFSDAFVTFLGDGFGYDEEKAINALKVPEFVKTMLLNARDLGERNGSENNGI